MRTIAAVIAAAAAAAAAAAFGLYLELTGFLPDCLCCDIAAKGLPARRSVKLWCRSANGPHTTISS